ncbi:hypothetical protein [Desulfonema magnum]|nr:hypothetical protein [Desulfonema magnum]
MLLESASQKTIDKLLQLKPQKVIVLDKLFENNDPLKTNTALQIKIPTPVGTYNPDWAVIFNNDKKIYFIAETKSAKDSDKLRKKSN